MSSGSPLTPDLKTRAALIDLADFVRMAVDLTGRGRAEYDGDIVLRLAGEAIISRVGEAVQRISDDFKDAHPGVPWRAIRNVRNLGAHEYDLIDHAANWEVLARGLPAVGRMLSLPI